MENLRTENETLGQKFNNLRSENTSLEQEAKLLKEKNQELKKSIAKIEKAYDSLESEYAQDKDEAKNHYLVTNESKQEDQWFQNKITYLEAENKYLKVKKQWLAKENEWLQNKITYLEEENDSLNDKAEALKIKLILIKE